VLLASAGLSALLLAASCGRSDSADATLGEASVILTTTSSSPYEGESGAVRRSELDAAIIALQPLQAGNDASAKAAAGLLRGAAQQGLAANRAVQAATAFRATTASRAAIRNAADLWAQEHARATARLAFDPGPQASELRSQIAALKAEQAELTEQLRAAKAESQRLTVKIDDLNTRSQALRVQAAEIRLSLIGRSATEAANRAMEIREISREADGLDTEAARLSARLDRGVALEIKDLEARVAQREGRTALIEDGLREINRQRGFAEEIAIRHRAAAADQEQRIVDSVASLEDVVNTTVLPGIEDAERLASSAGSSVRGTGSISAAAERTASGNASRQNAAVNVAAADIHDELAALFAGLAEAEPAFEAQADYAAKAQAHAATAQEHRNRAADAFENAARSLTASTPRGLDREKLEAAAAELDALAARLRGAPPPSEEELFNTDPADTGDPMNPTDDGTPGMDAP
jgi:hypothetical protein